MRDAMALILMVALTLVLLAPAAMAAIEQGPVYVGCETVREGGTKIDPGVETTYFKVVVDGETVHQRQVDECPLTA